MLTNALARRGALALWDVVTWAFASALVIGIRLDFTLSDVLWESVIVYLVMSAALLVGFGYATKFYRGRYLVGSYDEALGLAGQIATVGLVMLLVSMVMASSPPRSVVVLTPPLALLFAAAGRFAYRAIRDRSIDAERLESRRVLVYGAGDAGRQVVQLLRTGQDLVVGLVDDNPGKRHLRINGVPVVGTRETLVEAAEATSADAVIFAVPSAPGNVIGAAQEAAQRAGLDFLVLPRVSELIEGRVTAADIRPVEIGDVLGRHQVSTSISEIAGYLTGRRVLITGAGGSIGAELARQVHRFGPSSLVLLDRDESALHSVQLSIYGHGLLDSSDTVLADIRDVESLRQVFEDHDPQIVFHAAALKHLPMLERYPSEGWKTNVLGTLNLLRLSAELGVEHFVNISTDKAADATSVLGSTKRTAEQLTAWYAEQTGRSFMSVRFGNVLGSRGSMLHTFNAQIAQGGPVTVTHPDVTRYFMTIPEACELVVQAGAIGTAGEVMVLEMGEPVRILDVARRMIDLSRASDIKIVFTGLRPGEKLSETLFGADEDSAATDHPMIRSVRVPAVAPDDLADTVPHPATATATSAPDPRAYRSDNTRAAE